MLKLDRLTSRVRQQPRMLILEQGERRQILSTATLAEAFKDFSNTVSNEGLLAFCVNRSRTLFDFEPLTFKVSCACMQGRCLHL